MVKKKIIPSKPLVPNRSKGILELDRFSEASLSEWNVASNNLNELEDVLYFGLEPERRRLRSELIQALQAHQGISVSFPNWHRVVDFQYSLEPLSCAGSMVSTGGRFNAGADLEPGTLNPWPALYLAEDFETAFREKRQLKSSDLVDGLSPGELALNANENLSVVGASIEMQNLFDLTHKDSLIEIARVLKKIKFPERAKELRRSLKIPVGSLFMIGTAAQLYEALVESNWRILPVQFGLPAQSQIIGELIKSAGYEGVIYQSSKGPKRCISIFPEALKEGSSVKLVGGIHANVSHTVLDANTSAALEGWDLIPKNLRPY